MLKFVMNEKVLLMIILSYILGSINPATMITYIISRRDIRELGDGNPGTTNVFTNVNKFAGAFVFGFDALKGFVPQFLSYSLGLVGILPPLIGSFAVLGHDFPVFHKFKGGTGIATIIGGLFFFAPRLIVLTIIFVTPFVFLFSRSGINWHFRLSPFESGEAIGFLIVIFFLLFSEDVDAKIYMLFSTSFVVMKRINVVLSLLKIKCSHSEI